MPTRVLAATTPAPAPTPAVSGTARGAALSMHHWADPTAGVAEIGRVLAQAPRYWSGTCARRPARRWCTKRSRQHSETKEGGNGRVRGGKQPEPSAGRVGQRRSRVGDAHSKRQLGRISSSVGRKRTVASLRWAQSTSGEVSVG
jgi:hypothetical protein